MASEYAHILFNLLAVLALLLATIFLLKKFRMAKYSGKKHINIINMVPIGTKEKIILLEVNNSFLLVGATPNHIETLYVFNELEVEKSVGNEEKTKEDFSKQLAIAKTTA